MQKKKSQQGGLNGMPCHSIPEIQAPSARNVIVVPNDDRSSQFPHRMHALASILISFIVAGKSVGGQESKTRRMVLLTIDHPP